MDTLIGSRGFTLIEVLVVLFIMGMLVGLASAIARPDDREILQVEADRLAKLLELAIEEANLSGKSMAWTADKSGYRFWRMTSDNSWIEIRDNDLFRARTLPDGMTISSLQVENTASHGVAHSEMRLEFTPTNAMDPFSINMSLGAAHHSITASPIGELQVTQTAGNLNDEFAQR